MEPLNMNDVLAAEEIRERTYSDEEIENLRDELENYLDDASGCNLIKHPLITYMGYDPDSRETVAMLGRWIAQKQRGIEQFIAEKNWSQVLVLHETPYRMRVMMDLAPWMNDEDYWRVLGETWCGIEDPGTYLDELPWMLTPEHRGTKKRRLLMDEDEQAAYELLPDRLTIYRGCAESNRLGFSWSVDREQGEWFARRCGFSTSNKDGTLLLIGECSKSDVIAHFTRRDEAEIVVSPDDVKIIESVRVGEDSDQPLVGGGEASDE